MAEPLGPGGTEDELPQVEMEVIQPEGFEEGAEVLDDGQGGAIVQALTQGMESSSRNL